MTKKIKAGKLKIYIADRRGRVSLRSVSMENYQKYYRGNQIYHGYVYRSFFNGIFFSRSQTDPRPAPARLRRSHYKAYVYPARQQPEPEKFVAVSVHMHYSKHGEYQQSPFSIVSGIYNLPVRYADLKMIRNEMPAGEIIKGSYTDEWGNALVSVVLNYLRGVGWNMWRVPDETIESVFEDRDYFDELISEKEYGNKLGAGWARKKTRLFLTLDELLNQLNDDMESGSNEE